MKKLTVIIALLFGFCCLSGACKKEEPADLSLWDFSTLSGIEPEVRDAGYTYDGNENIKAVYFEGAQYNGENTEIFAYIGTPETEMPAGGYPAVVLVHGGLGRAFPDWVKLWTDRGYVAIAPSVDANITDSSNSNIAAANPKGGPNISITVSDMQNPENSWEYISVANLIFCHNILLAREDVNSGKTGITGISWGSYLMCIAVGVDNRFSFGIPVYGAGFMDEDVSGALAGIFSMDDEHLKLYRERFDPAAYMKRADLPMLWLAGADDASFSVACNQKCADLNAGNNSFSWREKLIHGQQPGDGSGLPEIFAFADSVVFGKEEMLRLDEGEFSDGKIRMQALNDVGISHAEVYYSSYPLEYWHDSGNVWSRAAVVVDGKNLSAEIPGDALFAFIKATDSNGYIVSGRCFSF